MENSRYPAGRIRICRRSGRRSDDGVASGRRDAVCGFHFLRLRSNHRGGGQESLPVGCCGAMVIRAPFGGGIHGGPFHSECPEGWFFHSPGLKLVAPSTPYDAKGLLKAAIRDPNPVIYFEHKFLYRRIKAIL